MKQGFSELRDGDSVDVDVAVLKVESGTAKNNTTYLKITMADSNRQVMMAKRWDVSDREKSETMLMGWARATGKAKPYEGTLEITLSGPLDPINEPENPSLFLPASAIPLSDLQGRLRGYIASVKLSQLNLLLREVFEDAKMSRMFERFPAAEVRHHNFLHGLLQHTIEVTDIVDAVCTKQRNWGPGRGRVSRDLAITGALLHDIGKLEEYEEIGHGVRFSTGGGLLGHVTQGVVRIARKIAQVRRSSGFDPALEEIVLHLLAAHHGKAEYGAPVPPKIAEAALIHYADVLSTEFFYFAEAGANVAEGQHSWKQWKMEGRKLHNAPLDILWGDDTEAEVAPGAPQLVWSVGETRALYSVPTPTREHEAATTFALPLLRLLTQSDAENNFATVRLPLIGSIAAGTPIMDSANVEEEIHVEAQNFGLGSAKFYLLRVQGDSMIGDGILDGDMIVARHQEDAGFGDIVVAMLEEGATVKRLVSLDGQAFLKASNPQFEPNLMPITESLRIQGRVVAIVR